jgi:hypothetical protein
MTECIIQGNTITGTLKVSGLNIAGRVSIVTIDDVNWTPLPAVPLDQRNAIGIQNSSAVEIKLNYDPSTIGYVGVKMGIEGERYYDITDAIPIYAKAAPGSGTVTVTVEEIS